MKQEIPPVLQYQILQLALELPASKFSWFRVQVKTFILGRCVCMLVMSIFLLYGLVADVS